MLILAPGLTRADDCDPAQARLRTPDGRSIALAVEVVADPAARAHGLMQRESLAPQTGMLFLYPSPQQVAFWMKDTLIPLDMLFFDADGRLAHLHANAVPHDLTPIPGAAEGDPTPERLLVLEVAGGEAARLGIVEGTMLDHAALDPACGLRAME